MRKHGQKSDVCKLAKNVIQSNQNIGEQYIKNDDGMLRV